MKARVLCTATATVALWLLFSRASGGAVGPITSVEAGSNGSPPYLLESITVGEYSVTTTFLATGRSSGETGPSSPITHADDFDLNTIASKLGTRPAWTVTMIGGRKTWTDSNGDNPDFFVFEAGMNDNLVIRAILAGHTLGRPVVIDPSNWGYTGLDHIGFYNWGQPIGGISFTITDLLDQDGLHLTNDSVIEGILFDSPTLDPALFAAVIPEPATILLLGLGGWLTLGRRR